MRKSVGVGDAGVTAGQLKNFFRQIEDGSITGPTLQSFMNEPSRFAPEKTDLGRVIRLLGKEKVVTAEQWGQAWGREVVETETGVLKFSQATLQSAADMNKVGYTDFRLVYCGGIALREQCQILGSDLNKQPCFYENSTRLLFDEKNDEWATFKPKPGYRLLDYKLRFKEMEWQAQEDEIAKFGDGYSRAHETDVSEGAFSFYKVYGERLLEEDYHWGQSLDSSDYYVYVGDFDAHGWNVHRRKPSLPYVFLGVVLARN